MNSPFNRFYNKQADIYEENTSDYDLIGSDELLGSVMCDLQPFDTDTDSLPNGLSENKAYKLYCGKNELIKNGRRVCVNDKQYRIVRAEEWDFGMSVMVKEV